MEEARAADRELAALGESAVITDAVAIAKLKVDHTRAWSLVHDPVSWSEPRKVKGKPAWLELVRSVWEREHAVAVELEGS